MEAWRDDQLKPEMEGSAACLQCHESIAADIPAHTHHSLESSGSDCYNCHMPHTTYGLMKAIRSHQIDVPSMEQSLKTGRPNACNLCHLDQTPFVDGLLFGGLVWSGKAGLASRRGSSCRLPALAAEGRCWHTCFDGMALRLGACQAGLAKAGKCFACWIIGRSLLSRAHITQRSLKSYEGLQDLAFDFTGDSESFSEAAQWSTAGVGANLDRYARPLRSAESPFSNIDRVGCGKVKEWQSLALQQIDGFAGVIPSQASMNDGSSA